MALFEAFNDTTTSDTLGQEEEEDLFFFWIFIFAILLPLSIFILFGNVLVISVVRGYNQDRHRAVYSFVGSLAVNDCLVGIALVPVYYTGIFVEEVKTNFYYCLSIVTILFASCSLSMLHVLIIAGDRYLAIYYPLKYHTLLSSRNITITIALTWTIALMNALLPYMGWKETLRKLEYCNVDKVWPISYVIFNFTFCFIIPLMVTFAIYLRIIQAARQQIRKIGILQIQTQPAPSLSNSTVHYHYDSKSTRTHVLPSMSDLKAITTTATVLGAFVLCYSPDYLTQFVLSSLNAGNSTGQPIRAPITEMFFNLLAFSNAAFNPVIYCFRYKEFKRALRRGILRIFPANYMLNLPPRKKRTTNVIELYRWN
jgi:hypothetical protein